MAKINVMDQLVNVTPKFRRHAVVIGDLAGVDDAAVNCHENIEIDLMESDRRQRIRLAHTFLELVQLVR